MRLIHLYATHATLGRLSVPLDPVTVLTGPNESGKTSRLEIPISVLSGLPPWASAASVEVQDGERVITVERIADPHIMVFDGARVGVRAAPEMIKTMFGAASTWTVADLMQRSPADRLTWINSTILDGVGWSTAKARKAAHATGAPDALKWPRGENGKYIDPIKASSGRDYLDQLVGLVRGQWTAANAAVQRLAKAVQQDAADRSTEALPEGTAAGWLIQRDQAHAELLELERANAAVAPQAAHRKSVTDRIEAYTKHIAHLTTTAERNAQAATDTAVQLEVARATVRQTLAAHDAATKSKDAMERSLSAADIAARNAATEAASHSSVVRVVSEVEAALRSVPIDDHTLLTPVIELLESYLAPPDLGSTDAALKGARAQAEASIRVWRSTAAAATAAAQRENELASLETHHKLLARQAEEEAEVARTAVRELNEELATLPEAAPDRYAEAIASRRELVSRAEAALRAISDAQGLRAVREAHKADHASALATRDILHQVGKACAELVGRLVAEAIGSLLADVNRVLAAMCAELRVSTAKGFSLELVRHDASHGFGSDSGNIILVAALQCAIASRLGGLRLVVVDRLEALEPARRTALLEALAREVSEGRVDNVLAACVGDWTPPAHVRHIHLGATT